MGAVGRWVAAAAPMAVTLLLLLQLAVVPGGDAAATRRPGAAAVAAAAERPGAADGGDETSRRDVRGAAKWLFPYFDDAQVLAFRNEYKDLGLSFDQLMDAEAGGHLGTYEAVINVGRAPPLNMRHAIMAYQAIMARLHDDDRCLDFVRQTTADEAGSCAAEKWRRCCRGTANDTDQVLLCAKHEHLLHPPAMTTASHAANSFRVEPLPLRTTVLAGLPAASLQGDTSAGVASADGAPPEQQQGQAVGRQATAGCNGTTTPGAARSASSVALAASIAALVADAASPAAAVDRTETAATARLVADATVVPFFFEDQYVEREVVVEDAWVVWCKEFLFFSAGCVEFCCTTQMAGSAVCDTSKNPDGCL